jgi:endoglycosylceramidase
VVHRRWVLPAAVVLGVMSTGLLAADSRAQVGPRDGSITSEQGVLRDGLGRQVVLRGLNVVDKQGWKGSLAEPMLTREMIEQLASIGFNHVRFGTTWASIEHDRETYDDDYIDQMVQQLDELKRFGIGAVIDMHQDTWGGELGSDGAPSWADPQCNTAPDADFDQATGVWMAEYASPAVNAAWSNFWNDGYGDADLHCTGAIQTDFVEMWGHLASRLAGHPAVIGYDILNEPWPSAPPGAFEQLHLMPMYRRVAGAIRRHDPASPIFFGPPLYSPAAPTVAIEPPEPNSVFAPHIYTETMFTGGALSTGARSDEIALVKDMEDAERMGVPLWIGEWGAIHDPTYVTQVYDLFDRHRVGSAFWADVQHPGSRFATEHEAPHVRPYPAAYPGEASWSYDAATGRFEMTVTVGPGTHEVELVVPERLRLSTTDPAVSFVSAGRSRQPCNQDHAQGRRPSTGCRGIWRIDGPGTFRLTLAPRSR